MADIINFNIPIKGRFVSGSMTEKRSKDWENKPIAPDDQRFEFAVAYPKQEFWTWLTQTFYPGPLATALTGFPHAMQAVQQWFGNGFNGFSMKMDDGDKPKRDGKVNQNTQGCFVVYFASMVPPTAYIGATPQTLTQIDTTEVKRGYYVLMSGSIKFNEKSGTQMGIYVNAGSVWLVERGPEISGGVDPETAFAGVTLPPGVAPLDLSNGAGAQFGGGVPGLPPQTAQAGFPPAVAQSAPVHTQTAPAALPGQGSMPQSVPGMTASPGNAQPYYGAMQVGQPPAQAGVPGLPPLPGQ